MAPAYERGSSARLPYGLPLAPGDFISTLDRLAATRQPRSSRQAQPTGPTRPVRLIVTVAGWPFSPRRRDLAVWRPAGRARATKLWLAVAPWGSHGPAARRLPINIAHMAQVQRLRLDGANLRNMGPQTSSGIGGQARCRQRVAVWHRLAPPGEAQPHRHGRGARGGAGRLSPNRGRRPIAPARK